MTAEEEYTIIWRIVHRKRRRLEEEFIEMAKGLTFEGMPFEVYDVHFFGYPKAEYNNPYFYDNKKLLKWYVETHDINNDNVRINIKRGHQMDYLSLNNLI